ncbi:SLC13 family permease [Escherichia coli]
MALAVGLMQGMPLDKVIGSIKAGVGGTLGSLALIMGFGAMLGKMLAVLGGAQRIATTLIAKFGKKHIQWAVVLTGFTVGFALFYEVGFVLMLPLVFTVYRGFREYSTAVCWCTNGGCTVCDPRLPATASGPDCDCHHFQCRYG